MLSHTPVPWTPRKNDAAATRQNELDIARTTQYHHCSFANCLRVVKGRTLCKRRAPFPLARDDWVSGDGSWGPKRLCAFLNNWNPPLMTVLRANHDTKLIMNGEETNILTWYITNYASKKQQRSSNVSALLAKRVAFHKVEERGRTDLMDINKRLIQRCANTLARDREFSGPEIMSYLMGWGDRYESHHYVGISADAIIRALKEKFPGLRAAATNVNVPAPDDTGEHPQVIAMVSGVIALKDQLHEYQYRGEEMDDMSLLSFVLDTYEAKAEEGGYHGRGGDASDDTAQRQIGRPPNRRVIYRQGFTKVGRCRVYRTPGHETLPHFMGGWFPRNDRPNERELYSASLLTLLKPWNDLSGLKSSTETFEHAFRAFVDGSPKKTLDIIENIQYYYECYDGAKRRRELGATQGGPGTDVEYEEEERQEDLTTDSQIPPSDIADVTDEDIEAAYESRGNMRERLYAEVALNTAFGAGVFSEIVPPTTFLPMAEKACSEDMTTFRAWGERLKSLCRREVEEGGPSIFPGSDVATLPSTTSDQQPGAVQSSSAGDVQSTSSQRPKRDLLKTDQRRAHDIIEKQLLRRIAGKNSDSLKVCKHKTHLIIRRPPTST
jgi:hypothetical protein